MKNLAKLLSVLVILFTILFNACKKDEMVSENKPVQQKKCYVNNIEYGNSNSDKFYYNSNNTLQKVIIIGDGGRDTQAYNFEYDSKGRVIKALWDADGVVYSDFKYNSDNTIDKVELNISTNLENPYEATTFEYNENKRVKKATISKVAYNAIDYMYFEYKYDTKGNVTQEDFYTRNEFTKQWELSTKIASEYDDKSNPFSEVNVPPIHYRYFTKSKNNTVYQNIWTKNSTWKMTSTIQYTPENYPQTIRYKDQDGNYSHSTKYTYKCK